MDPAGCMTFDWVHNNLQDGVFGAEVQLILTACEGVGLTRAAVKTELSDQAWTFPLQTRAKSKQLHRVFDPYRESADDSTKLKCSASEMLGLYAILRYIVAANVPRIAELERKLASFGAACTVIDIIVAAKNGTTEAHHAAVSLQRALQQHMSLHMAAYGEGSIRPKHHWNFDLPGQFARDGMVLDAFVVERTHLKVKRVADLIKNTSCFERSVLAGVLNCALEQARGAWVHALLGSTKQVGDNVYMSEKMHIYGFLVAAGDLVHDGGQVGLVQTCLLIDGVLYAVVEILRRQGAHTANWGLWSATSVYAIWVASGLKLCVAWKAAPHAAVLVLL